MFHRFHTDVLDAVYFNGSTQIWNNLWQNLTAKILETSQLLVLLSTSACWFHLQRKSLSLHDRPEGWTSVERNQTLSFQIEKASWKDCATVDPSFQVEMFPENDSSGKMKHSKYLEKVSKNYYNLKKFKQNVKV